MNAEMNNEITNLITNSDDVDKAIEILVQNRVMTTIQAIITDRLCAQHQQAYQQVTNRNDFLTGMKAALEQLGALPDLIDKAREDRLGTPSSAQVNGSPARAA